MTEVAIFSSDGYNAVYVDGVCEEQGKPKYLDAETAYRVYKMLPGMTVRLYTVPEDVCEANLDGEPYPELLSNWPTVKCTLVAEAVATP